MRFALGPTMVNTATLNFGRTATVRTANTAIPNLCSLGTIATCPLPNYLSYDFSAPGFLGYDYENVFGGTENLGWQIHSHHLELGAVYQHVQMNNDGVFQVNPGPTVTTGSSSYTGQALADAQIGDEAKEQILHRNAAAVLARVVGGTERERVAA